MPLTILDHFELDRVDHHDDTVALDVRDQTKLPRDSLDRDDDRFAGALEATEQAARAWVAGPARSGEHKTEDRELLGDQLEYMPMTGQTVRVKRHKAAPKTKTAIISGLSKGWP